MLYVAEADFSVVILIIQSFGICFCDSYFRFWLKRQNRAHNLLYEIDFFCLYRVLRGILIYSITNAPIAVLPEPSNSCATSSRSTSSLIHTTLPGLFEKKRRPGRGGKIFYRYHRQSHDYVGLSDQQHTPLKNLLYGHRPSLLRIPRIKRPKAHAEHTVMM